MSRWAGPALVVLGLVPAAVAYAAMLGLGLHRHAPPWAISTAATILVFGPGLLASAFARGYRPHVFGAVLAMWSLGVLLALPVYFPGERRQAVATGIALVGLGAGWETVARNVADQLPEEPRVAEPEVPEAATLVAEAVPEAIPLNDDQIALPFEGEGRRLSVPVVFEHDGKTVETWMMLDTGATYTTLPLSVLADLGVTPTDADPVIRLHTANGEREAQVVLLETVWLGDLSLSGVAIATCEACASSDTVGLLGLNVTGGYNLFIDSDRREAVFTERFDRDQRLDVTPFVELSATFTRFPGGRVEVVVRLDNTAGRPIRSAIAGIRCAGEVWTVDLHHVDVGETATERRRLPEHDICEQYQIALDAATW